MALSYTNVPTHGTGDKLPVADWNSVAGILNAGLSTFATKGTYASTSTNGTAPFFVYAAVVDETTNGSGELTHTFPQAFPTNLISVIATLTYYNAGGTTQLGHAVQVDYALSDKTKAVIVHANAAGATVNSTATRLNILAIGY